jgi:hypothetical protein
LPDNCVESKQCIQMQRSYTCAATFCTYTYTYNISGIYFYTYIYMYIFEDTENLHSI